MTDSQKSPFRVDERLEELLDRWDELIRLGRKPEPSELCRDCPEMIFPLTRTIQQLQEMDELLEAPPDEPPPVPLPEKIGPFVVESELGRGGMGVVYCCKQEGTDRRIAVKVLRPSPADEPDSGRFRREMLVAGAITDPGVVHIYDAGVDESSPIRWRWIAMELIDGVHLDRYVFQQKLSRTEIIAIFRQICSSVSALHQKGIIHQDLKPSNILVDATGRPQIVDFGIAAAVDPEGEIQLDNAPLAFGTLPYLPPESLDGDETVDVRTDIYGLGIILFELLTNNSMRQWHETTKVNRQTTDLASRNQWIALESAILPIDLRQVVLKAVDPSRSKRYTSVDALSADLKRYLDGYTTEASGAAPFRRVWKWCSRNRLGAFAGFLMVLMLAGWTLYIRSSRQQSNEREAEITAARRLLTQGQWQLEIGRENQKYIRIRSDVDKSPTYALERLQRGPFPETRNSLARHLLLRRAQWLIKELPDAPPDINRLAYSADGLRLAACSDMKGVILYSIQDGTIDLTIPLAENAEVLGTSPDLRFHLVHQGPDRPLAVCSAGETRELTISNPSTIRSGDISPDGSVVALGMKGGEVVLVPVDSSLEQVAWQGTGWTVSWIDWNDPGQIHCCSPGGTFRTLDPATMQATPDVNLRSQYAEIQQLAAFDYSEDMEHGECWLLARRRGLVIAYHPEYDIPLMRHPQPQYNPVGIHLLPPRSVAVAAAGSVTATDVYTGEVSWMIEPAAEITASSVRRDGEQLAFATDAGELQIYRTRPVPWSDELNLTGPPDKASKVTAVAFQNSPTPVLLGRDDGSLAIWDAIHGEEFSVIPVGSSAIREVSAWVRGPDRFTACVFNKQGIQLVEWTNGEVTVRNLLKNTGHRSHVAAFSDDGKTCLLSTVNNDVHKVDVATGTMTPLTEVRGGATAIAFDKANEQWLIGYANGELRVTDSAGRLLDEYDEMHEGEISGICVLDGRILTVSHDRSLAEWNQAGRLVVRNSEHRSAIKAIAVSADGQSLATADRAGNVFLWDPITLDLRLSVSESSRTIESLHFLRHDCLLSSSPPVSNSLGASIRVWGTYPPQQPAPQ